MLQEYARLDTSFSTLFTCNSNLALANPARVTGALRAMCRICANISNPANNLTLVGNYQCLPRSVQNSLSCLFPVISNIAECRPLLLGADASKVSVSATANVTGSTYGKKSLFYLAMAFRSVSYGLECLNIRLSEASQWIGIMSFACVLYGVSSFCNMHSIY